MKNTNLIALVLAFLFPIWTNAQTVELVKRDSQALATIHDSFGGPSSGLDWFNGHPETWGTNDILVDTVQGNGDGELDSLEVVAINISGRGLTGAFPGAINDLQALRRLDISKNRISSLPSSISLLLLTEVILSSNLLEDLPSFDQIEGSMSLLDCRDNYLVFNDLLPLQGAAVDFFYEDQIIDRELDTIVFRGDIAPLNAYRVDNPLPSNEYAWTKPGTTLTGNEKILTIGTSDPKSPGLYNLVVTNEDLPDLTFDINIELIVIDSEDPPFDTTTIIIRGPNAFDPSFYLDDEIAELIEVDSCRCLSDKRRIALWKGIPSLLDLNTIRDGAGGGVEKDTSDLNFFLEVKPIPTIEYCDNNFSSPAADGNQPFNAKVAIVGTGIANHRALQSYFYAESTPLNCLPGGSRVAYDFTLNQVISPNRLPVNPHETHVAGIITKNFPNNINLDIADLKIFDTNDEGRLFELICAIHFAIEAGVDVINLSLGYYSQEPSILLFEALQEARDNNITVVISSGNDGENNDNRIRWPGNFIRPSVYGEEKLDSLNNLIVIAGLDLAQDGLATFSNIGQNTVHIAAPGTATRSTVNTDEFDVFSGTSMAAAEVSRIVAILKAYAPNSANITPRDIITAINSSGDDLTKENEFLSLLKNDKKVNLIAAARALNPPIPDDLITGLQDDYSPPVERERPPTIVNNNRIRNISNFSLTLNKDKPNAIYEDVRFVVRRSTGNASNPWNIIYEHTCKYASEIRWDGIKLDNMMINPRNAQPFLVIEIPGQSPIEIRIQPDKLRR